MLFYVVIFKTDIPNKPSAVHLTKLKAKYRQKQVFKMFSKQFAENGKEYYVVSLEKDGKPRNFYSKKAALEKVRKLALEHGYFVKLPKNTWGKSVEPTKPARKKPANKQFEVESIPTDELREYVLESIADYSPVDVAANLMFKRNIPVFSMKTRQLGVRTLFANSGYMKIILSDENERLIDELRYKVHQQNKQPGDTYVPPGRSYHYPGLSSLQGRSDILIDWNSRWYTDKKRVNRVCGVLTRLYSETPGSRDHTQDAVPLKDISSVSYKILVV